MIGRVEETTASFEARVRASTLPDCGGREVTRVPTAIIDEGLPNRVRRSSATDRSASVGRLVFTTKLNGSADSPTVELTGHGTQIFKFERGSETPR